MTQSPMNLSSVPPAAKMASTECEKKPSSSSATSEALSFSDRAVKPTRSAKSTVASVCRIRVIEASEIVGSARTIVSITAGEW